jgi:hypothetical protein
MKSDTPAGRAEQAARGMLTPGRIMVGALGLPGRFSPSTLLCLEVSVATVAIVELVGVVGEDQIEGVDRDSAQIENAAAGAHAGSAI